jgi:hypothetical protein
LIKESKVPHFVRRNKEAEKRLADLTIVVEGKTKLIENLTKEQIASLTNPTDRDLGKSYQQIIIAEQILKKKEDFVCFCELRERMRRERDGESPTNWEFIEYLFSENK